MIENCLNKKAIRQILPNQPGAFLPYSLSFLSHSHTFKELLIIPLTISSLSLNLLFCSLSSTISLNEFLTHTFFTLLHYQSIHSPLSLTHFLTISIRWCVAHTGRHHTRAKSVKLQSADADQRGSEGVLWMVSETLSLTEVRVGFSGKIFGMKKKAVSDEGMNGLIVWIWDFIVECLNFSFFEEIFEFLILSIPWKCCVPFHLLNSQDMHNSIPLKFSVSFPHTQLKIWQKVGTSFGRIFVVIPFWLEMILPLKVSWKNAILAGQKELEEINFSWFVQS